MYVTPLGQIIRMARIGANTTMARMAREFGMNPSEICAIETGKKPMPEGYLQKVADFLKAEYLKQFPPEARDLLSRLK